MKNLYTLLLIFISLSGFTQSFIKGYVEDEKQLGIPYATIAVKNVSDSALYKMEMTDSLGNFSIPVVTGNYYFTVQFVGYKSYQSKEISFDQKPKTISPKISLEPQIEMLEGAEIQVDAPVIRKTARGLEVDVAKSPILSSGTTKEILGKIPGVIMNPDGTLMLKGRTGVQVYIDGKRTYMSLEQVMQYLESLPATDIEKVEIFDTPPAKYDAEGSGGVINIVLKNGAALGLNGMVGVNLGHGKYHKFVPWANFNYRNKKINVYGTAWYVNKKTYQLYDYTATAPITDSTETFFDSEAERIFTPYGYGGRIGIDYKLNNKNTIGFLVFANSGVFRANEPSTTLLSGTHMLDYNNVKANTTRHSGWGGHGYNLNYQRDIKKGQQLNVDFDFVLRPKSMNTSDQIASNTDYLENNFVQNHINDIENTTDITIGVAKLDYSREINEKWRLETGAKSSWVTTKNQTKQFTGNDEQNLTYDSLQSNKFNYQENIYAGYVVLVGKFKKKTSFDLGVRAEYTFSEGYSPTVNTTTTRNYLNLFPNLAVKYTISKDVDFSLSYARRLTRPQYWLLNPFEIQMNPFYYKRGNPYLQPQYANTVSTGVSYKSAVFLTFSYTHTNNAITEVLNQASSKLLTYYTTINLNEIRNYSVNFVLPIPITDWWSLRLNMTTFYNHQLSPSEEGQIDNSLWSYSLNIQQSISLPKGFKLEFGGYYNSAVFWNTLYVDPHYQIDAGLSYKYKRFNFRLSYQDFLNIRESYGWVRQGNVDRDYYYKAETRVAQLSVSYRLGNHKIKGARKRKSASQDLQNRGED